MTDIYDNGRIEWIDIGKYICIMFVMLSHLQSGTENLAQFYRPFFLTAFFFIAGYVYKPPDSFKVHIYKKFRGLFVPWFIFSNFNLFLSMIVTLKGKRDFPLEFARNMMQIRGYGDGVWFVAALFVTFIPFYFIIKWDRPIKACLVATMFSILSILFTYLFPADIFPWNRVALPWHLEYMFQAMFWMVLGYYFRIYGEAVFDKRNTFKNRCFLWMIYFIFAYLIPSRGVFEIPILYIRSMVGIAALISVCKIVKSNKYIRFVGKNTLIYFALHGKVYAVLEMLLEKFAGNIYFICLKNAFLSCALAFLLTVAMSFLLVIPAMVINRYLPWVLGRKERSKERK